MTVELILVPVEGVHLNRDALIRPGVLDHDVPVLFLIQGIDPLQEALPGIFRCDGIGKKKQTIVKILCHFVDAQIVCIWPPDASVINVPAPTGVIHQNDATVIIHEHPAVTDLERFITWIRMWSQGFNRRVKATHIRCKRISFTVTAIAFFLNGFDVHRCEIILGGG